MNITLFKTLLAMAPISVLCLGSEIVFRKERTLGSFLQLVGAGFLVVVVLTHFCEALHLFPSMGWGDKHSVGHYLDFGSAVLALTLLLIGVLLHALSKRHA